MLFLDCYALIATLNFGIIADELIESAKLVDDDPELKLIRLKWEPHVQLKALRCFQFETISTGSRIRIYAMHFEII